MNITYKSYKSNWDWVKHNVEVVFNKGLPVFFTIFLFTQQNPIYMWLVIISLMFELNLKVRYKKEKILFRI